MKKVWLAVLNCFSVGFLAMLMLDVIATGSAFYINLVHDTWSGTAGMYICKIASILFALATIGATVWYMRIAYQIESTLSSILENKKH